MAGLSALLLEVRAQPAEAKYTGMEAAIYDPRFGQPFFDPQDLPADYDDDYDSDRLEK